ncbi:hypothetical protein GCM10027321_28490 [Massilia terrae]|uniref:ABC transporter permease n=1 Tax=Massilia terrae TaxID=1811224 RepID=A0ABT2D0J2_9BURK|nr:ABC transporter permease [Massilia terrae]MCS0659754.1 ABC transporter permease [Massilia terrae]
MNAVQLALRNLICLRPRTMGPLVAIALLLCALDLFAGSRRMQLQRVEQQAAFEQGYGHLAVLPLGGGFGTDAEAVRRLAAATPGVTLVVPRTGPTGERQRFAAYLARPEGAERALDQLAARLRDAGLHAEVRRGESLSGHYVALRDAVNAELAAAVLAMLVLAGAITFAVATVNCVERRRELAVLRAFGLPRGGLVAHVMAEALMVGLGAIVLAGGIGSFGHWAIGQCSWLGSAGVAIELEPGRVLLALLAVMSVVGAAALRPALKAAGVEVTAGLRECEV